MAAIENYRSHPDKKLVDHVHGVVTGTGKLTDLNVAELAAIFHDVGKLNPNFQKKLDNPKIKGYSNHAYLSAFAFLCYFSKNAQNLYSLFDQQREWIASIVATIAHHHGNLPNFSKIFRDEESNRLLSFLKSHENIPASDFIQAFLPHSSFNLSDTPLKEKMLQILPVQLCLNISNPLKFFLETQFSFSALIQADKADASGYQSRKADVERFCLKYNYCLDQYLHSLKSTTDLNKLRTQIRIEAQSNIREELPKGKRLFELTAPTGAGKTLMLLSLAGEILKSQRNLRIIYALPFLSITEQVESELKNKIFTEYPDYIRRVDSKTDNLNFEALQKELDDNPDAIKQILAEQFAENNFDYPFVITTFVRLFETFLSNKNATLLKLPNFANTIFLIDEIQALPPRLYGFFIAYLDEFCRKFNSYAIISTATMPNFNLPIHKNPELKQFFKNYYKPCSILSYEHFQNPLFNRYTIETFSESIAIEDLSSIIHKQERSALIILNTIQDTKDLYKKINDIPGATIQLLNTNFTPNDRKKKISKCKELLEENKRIILISTQLIEAGVDIDFPIVMRDIATISSLIQSAGRANRNGRFSQKGKVIIFELVKEGKPRANSIYRGEDRKFLEFAKERFYGKTFEEAQLFEVQQIFFDFILENTLFGYHKSNKYEIDFVKSIRQIEFENIGKFKLIDEKEYGEEFRYYIPVDDTDTSFEKLESLYYELLEIKAREYKKRKLKLIQIDSLLKSMAGQIVQIRLRKNDSPPIVESSPYFGIYKLSRDYYSFKKGVQLSFDNQLI